MACYKVVWTVFDLESKLVAVMDAYLAVLMAAWLAIALVAYLVAEEVAWMVVLWDARMDLLVACHLVEKMECKKENLTVNSVEIKWAALMEHL